MTGLFASIPSPGRGVLHLGPLPIRAYGLMLAFGVLAAVRIADRRAIRFGLPVGTVQSIATPVVVGGVVGARVYHLFTGYDWTRDGIVGTVQIWNGGLSIWGAVLGGALATWWVTRRLGFDRVVLFDVLAPAVAVGQAIGRWGNWFNQELFGRPTSLPWGVKIDPSHRPAQYSDSAVFHPTFLYESLWLMLMFFLITKLERRGALGRGQSVALYVALYTFERFWMELLRVDSATRLFGVRFNALLSATLCVAATAQFVALRTRAGHRPTMHQM